MDQVTLVSRCYVLVSQGTTPLAAAEKVLDDAAWDALPEIGRRQLAVLGLSVKVNERVDQVRREPVAEKQPESRSRPLESKAEIIALHRTLNCNQGEWHFADGDPKRCMWLREVLAAAPGKPRDKVIAERQKASRKEKILSVARWNRDVQPFLNQYASDYAKKVLKSIPLLGADGTMKSLLDFTAADARKWADTATVLARNWAEKQAWFTSVCDALGKYKAATIGQLPGEIADRLADEAEAIWKREVVAA